MKHICHTENNSQQKSKNIIIGFIIIFILSLVTMQSAMAFFSDEKQSTDNTFQAIAVFATATPTSSPTPTASPTLEPTATPTETPSPTLTPTPTPVQHLVISEVLIDPSLDQQIEGDGGSSRGEFVEIHNPTSVDVNLTDWHIFNGSGQENFSGTLQAGAFLIVTGATESEFRAVWPDVPSGTLFHTVADGTIFDGLSGSGGTIYLRVIFPTIDSISWGSNTAGFVSGCGFTCPEPATGTSLGRSPLNYDTDSAHDFTVNNPPNPGQ